MRILFALIGSVILPSALAEGLPQALTDELDRAGTARVIVLFDIPELAEPPGRHQRISSIAEVADSLLADLGPEVVVHHRFNLVRSLALTVTPEQARQLASAPRVIAIGLDQGGGGHLDLAVPRLNMDQMHALEKPPGGLKGQGAKIAIVDSGIDATHSDLADALVDEACFCSANGNGCCPSGATTQFGSGAAADDHGHGTWTTGLALSRGNVAPVGPAPEASVVSVKVLNASNAFCCTSDVTAAFDWLASNHPDLAVVNASLGTAARYPGACDDSGEAAIMALGDAVNALNANGTLVVASTGNNGDESNINAPACLSGVVATGATFKRDYAGSISPFGCVDSDPEVDQLTCYTNASPELEIVAPGSRMKSTRKPSVDDPSEVTGEALHGTSFAAPLVTGCAAQIRAAEQDLELAMLRTALTVSSVTVKDERNGLSYPRLDCMKAYNSLFPVFVDRFELVD